MQLTHKIALKPTVQQENYFKRAAGTSRFVWNWALAEWKFQYALGEKPNAMMLKKQFNQIKYKEFPWLVEMHRDSHAQPFAYLQKAWQRFFSELKANKQAHEPKFKKKGKCRDSFYVANDKFRIEGKEVYLPKVGQVILSEPLRFVGKILGATVSRTAQRWFIAVQVDVSESTALKHRTAHEVIGVDLGLSAAATLSDGKKINSPKPLKAALRRLKIRGRRVSRKIEAAKIISGYVKNAPLPKGTILPTSNNRKKSSLKLVRLHARITNLRVDFTHKLTTQLCRENQAVVIEDLNVKGMLANDRLARAMNDVGFGTIRRQLEYKAQRYGTELIVANRWYPSSRLCSTCGWYYEALSLSERVWQCRQCQTLHDRDVNAALNLKRLATRTALPVANHSVTNDTALRKVLNAVGKVTPVSYECGFQNTSGQEKNREHISSHF
jgi:putative transposase